MNTSRNAMHFLMVGGDGVSESPYFSALAQTCGRKDRFDAQKVILALPAHWSCVSHKNKYGAPIDEIRKAVCRDRSGRALGPVGAALDLLGDRGRGRDRGDGDER
jgi:hypothetical protein